MLNIEAENLKNHYPKGYYTIEKKIRIFVTTNKNEKFLALLDPTETIGDMNKRISNIYKNNYSKNGKIKSSSFKDFLLPKDLIVSNFLEDFDSIVCTFYPTPHKSSSKELEFEAVISKKEKKINEKLSEQKQKNQNNKGKKTSPKDNIKKDNVIPREKKEKKEIIQNKIKRIFPAKDLFNVSQKKIEKENDSINLAKHSKIFEDISLLQNLQKIIDQSLFDKQQNINENIERSNSPFQNLNEVIEMPNESFQNHEINEIQVPNAGEIIHKPILDNNKEGDKIKTSNNSSKKKESLNSTNIFQNIDNYQLEPKLLLNTVLENNRKNNPIEPKNPVIEKNQNKNDRSSNKKIQQKTPIKLVANLTSKAFKNNLMETPEKNKINEEELKLQQENDPKTIILKEINTDFVKKTITKINESIKTQEKMTGKKETRQTNKINELGKKSKLTEGEPIIPNRKKLRSSKPEKTNKGTPSKKPQNSKTIIKDSKDLIELSSTSEEKEVDSLEPIEDKDELDKPENARYKKFLKQVNLHYRGELDEVNIMCSKEGENNNIDQDLKEFERRDEKALVEQIDDIMSKFSIEKDNKNKNK